MYLWHKNGKFVYVSRLSICLDYQLYSTCSYINHTVLHIVCDTSCINPLGTVDLKFYQSQGLSTFWGFIFLLIKSAFYLSW